MEVFFATGLDNRPGRPFILDSNMRWLLPINHFLRDVSIIEGKTYSPHTWRAYAYHLFDFLSFCERIERSWNEVLELHLAAYRNELMTTPSPLTKRRLAAGTVNGRLTTVCLFLKFALRKGYITQLPFSFKDVRIRRSYDDDMFAHLHGSSTTVEANRLMLRTYESELEIPSNEETGRFISSLGSWRDGLIAETMWVSGLRREEVCTLSVNALPEDPFSLKAKRHKVRIFGKGRKWRSVYLPVRLLRRIARYIELERNPLVRKYKTKTDQIWVSDRGRPIRPSTINKFFNANSARCGVKVTPHDLRRSYATNRLIFLEEKGAPVPCKIVQLELGHSHRKTTEKYIRYVEQMRAEVIASHGDFIDQLTAHIKENDERQI